MAINAIRAHDHHDLVLLAIAITAAGLVRLVLSVFRRLIAGQVSLGVEVDLRNRLYGHLQRLELSFFDRQQTGQLMSRATVDLQSVRFFLGYGLIFIAQSVVTILLAAVAMFLLQPGPGGDLARAGAVRGPDRQPLRPQVPAGDAGGPAADRRADRRRRGERLGRPRGQGVRPGGAPASTASATPSSASSTSRCYATRIQAFFNPLISFLPNLGLAAILLFGGREVIDGTLSVGAFTAFYAYLLMLISPMRTLGYMLGAAQRSTASGARIFQILDREPRIVAPPDAPPLPDGGGRVTLAPRQPDVRGRDPPGAERRQPRCPGRPDGCTRRRDGLGQVGAGAAAAAPVRRHRGTGRDRRRRRALGGSRSACATRSRSSTTTRSCSRPPSTTTSPTPGPTQPARTCERAATAAQAAGFIERLPDGYDTRIGERGLTLSGGQRQRIAIARAILADPRILILDDATSSVDSSTEMEIKSGLGELLADRTTFVIAHRLSTIALADRIVVLEDGRLVADGSHSELLESSDLYREIVEKGMPDQVFLTRRTAEVAGL